MGVCVDVDVAEVEVPLGFDDPQVTSMVWAAAWTASRYGACKVADVEDLMQDVWVVMLENPDWRERSGGYSVRWLAQRVHDKYRTEVKHSADMVSWEVLAGVHEAGR